MNLRDVYVTVRFVPRREHCVLPLEKSRTVNGAQGNKITSITQKHTEHIRLIFVDKM